MRESEDWDRMVSSRDKLTHQLVLSPMAGMRVTPQFWIGAPSYSDGKALASACSQEGVRCFSRERTSLTALSSLRQGWVL
jgi:hypothetical protein